MPLLEQVLKKNPDSVKIVHKNFPLQFHLMAFPSAVAAHAAGEQGKFWEYHDALYAEKKITKETFNRVANKMGLDMVKFENDMKSPSITGLIRNDMVEAKNIGVTGTPTIFINGRKLVKRTMAGFQKMINEELQK